MASAITMPTCSFCLSSLSQSSSNTRKESVWNISNSAVSLTQVSNFQFSKWVPQLGLCQFSQWNGLKNLGISTPQLTVKMGKKGRCKGKGVYASLFGVGAPEALVIGVVALLVFGPKGLAEVARNLGKTLRAFQPTIRELQDVSREFKSTLEREIGLDDIQASNQNTYNSNISRNPSSPSPNSSSEASQKEIDPNGSPSPSKAYSTEDYLKITEEQLKSASASQQQSEKSTSPSESQSETQTVSQDAPEQAASAMPLPGKTENEK